MNEHPRPGQIYSIPVIDRPCVVLATWPVGWFRDPLDPEGEMSRDRVLIRWLPPYEWTPDGDDEAVTGSCEMWDANDLGTLMEDGDRVYVFAEEVYVSG